MTRPISSHLDWDVPEFSNRTRSILSQKRETMSADWVLVIVLGWASAAKSSLVHQRQPGPTMPVL
jgi:hypothetical protein